MNYTNLKAKPKAVKNLIVTFEIDSKRQLKDIGREICELASFGEINKFSEKEINKMKFGKLAPIFFDVNKKKKQISIAYPIALFEKNSITHLLSVLVGSLMKVAKTKRILIVDAKIPQVYIKTFQGPYYGVTGIRSLLGIYERAITGCTVKNQFAMTLNQSVDEIKKLWYKGVDVIREDERLADLSHNKFYARVRAILKAQSEVEKETGSKKLYVFNVTGTPDQIFQRSDYIKKMGGYAVMVNVVATGMDNIQMLRKSNLGVVIYAHEGFSGMLTYADHVKISAGVYLQLLRLSGCDFLDFGELTRYGSLRAPYRKKVIDDIMFKGLELDNLSKKFSNHHEVMPVFSISEDDTLRTKVSDSVSHDITYMCL